MYARPLPLASVIEVANSSVVAMDCISVVQTPGHVEALPTGIKYIPGKEIKHNILTAGFISSPRYITTVAHGIEACKGNGSPYKVKMQVMFRNNPKTYFAKVVRYNRLHDVAILQLVGRVPYVEPLEILTEAPPAGTHVIALGHPQFLFWSAAEGIVSADRWSTDPLMHVIQVSCPINHGNSGGPVINDKGQVVGITSFYIDNPSLGFIVAGDFVKAVAYGLHP